MKDKLGKSIAIFIALLIVLVINLIVNISHLANYEAQKASGNARWQQVEERLVEMEDKIENLK